MLHCLRERDSTRISRSWKFSSHQTCTNPHVLPDQQLARSADQDRHATFRRGEDGDSSSAVRLEFRLGKRLRASVCQFHRCKPNLLRFRRPVRNERRRLHVGILALPLSSSFPPPPHRRSTHLWPALGTLGTVGGTRRLPNLLTINDTRTFVDGQLLFAVCVGTDSFYNPPVLTLISGWWQLGVRRGRQVQTMLRRRALAQHVELQFS